MDVNSWFLNMEEDVMAKLVNQYTFKAPNKPGVLAEIAKTMGQKKINILNMCACTCGKEGHVRLTTAADPKAKTILKKYGYKPKADKLIALNFTNKPGRLAPSLVKLAKAKINVKSCVFTTAGKKVGVLLNTSNNKKAAKIL